MSDLDIEATAHAPEGDEETGTSNRRGRGVFAAVLLLLLLLCAVTTITQTYVVSGGDNQVIRSVTRNLECLQCHVELVPELSMERVHNPFELERCTTCHTPHGEMRTETVIEGIRQVWNRTRTLVEWLPLKIVLDVFGTGDELAGTEEGAVVSEKKTPVAGEKSELVLPMSDLCWMCHGDMGSQRNEQYPHAPFVNGNCVDCHDPHASEFTAMLVMDPRDLCITCHRIGPELSRMQVHSPVEGFFCTDCHDPHGSAYKGILVDNQRDLCFTCHPSVARLAGMGVQHGPFLNDACTDCHEPHGSNYTPLLRDAQPALCYSCHPGIKTDFLKVSHHPVGTISLNCSDCHDPHATNYDGLLYAEDNQVCYQCHSGTIKAKYDRSAHNGTPCWRCHTPHGSDFGPLLKNAQPEVCFPCHARVDFDDAAGGNDRNKHPVRPVYWDVSASKPLTCTTSCHDPHGTPNYFMLRHYNYPKDGNCLICHGLTPGHVVGVDY